MQTPWGDVPVRDAHAHLFSRNFFRILASQKAGLPEENPDHAIVEQLGGTCRRKIQLNSPHSG